MMHSDSDILQRTEMAVKYCQEQIIWYEKRKFRHRIAYQLLGVVIIINGLLTPLLILLTNIKIFSVITSTCTFTALVFYALSQPKEHYLRFAHTTETLKDHLLKFQTRTTERYMHTLPPNEALDRFVDTISIITSDEVSAWRAYLQ